MKKQIVILMSILVSSASYAADLTLNCGQGADGKQVLIHITKAADDTRLSAAVVYSPQDRWNAVPIQFIVLDYKVKQSLTDRRFFQFQSKTYTNLACTLLDTSS